MLLHLKLKRLVCIACDCDFNANQVFLLKLNNIHNQLRPLNFSIKIYWTFRNHLLKSLILYWRLPVLFNNFSQYNRYVLAVGLSAILTVAATITWKSKLAHVYQQINVGTGGIHSYCCVYLVYLPCFLAALCRIINDCVHHERSECN